MENGGYLFAAYSIIWAVLFGYVAVLIRRQVKLRRDIELLKKSMQEKPGD